MHVLNTFLLMAAVATASVALPPQQRMERALLDVEARPEELLAAINDRRLSADLERLETHSALQRATREEAVAIAAGLEEGQPIESASSRRRLEERLLTRGYQANAFTASIAVNPKHAHEVATDLMGTVRDQVGDLWSAELLDVGIGVAEFEWSMVYVVVLGRTAADVFAESVSQLVDREQVRTRLLAEVNTARAGGGRGTIELSTCLDQVAQEYADRMLREGFFGHEAPEREDVASRVRKGRCDHRPVGENLALGPDSPEVVIREWLDSSSHRRTLMDPNFSEMGLGLATGRGPDGYRIIWVQVLGKRTES